MYRLLSLWVGNEDAPRVLVEYTIKPEDYGGMPAKVKYRDIQNWIAENYSGMLVDSEHIALMKRRFGLDLQRDASRPRKRPRPRITDAKAEAMEAAFRHFGML